MCIAIYIPQGEKVTKADFKRSFETNPHGVGIAYIHPVEGLTVYKCMKFKDFWKKYKEIRAKAPDSNYFVHFRKKTHGEATIDNVHPFWVDKDTVFMHNGTIYPEVPHDKDGDMSDTRRFNINVLQKLPEDWYENKGIKRLVEDYIGKSRIAVMNSKGEVTIFNETIQTGDSGPAHWYNGVWYSNEYYKEKATGFSLLDYNDDWKTYSASVDPTSRYYRPIGAEWLHHSKKIWMKYDIASFSTLAWDCAKRMWRKWDRNKEEFFADNVIDFASRGARRDWLDDELRSLDNDDAITSLEKCESCQNMIIWYELETYKDEYLNKHVICEDCAKGYLEVGLHLTKVTAREAF